MKIFSLTWHDLTTTQPHSQKLFVEHSDFSESACGKGISMLMGQSVSPVRL